MPRKEKIRRVIPISGKDSLATAIVQTEREPRDDYEYVFWDVGMELPETYRWLDEVEKKLRIKIYRGGSNLETAIAQTGFLPSQSRRYCTKLTKIGPYRRFVNEDPSVDLVINYVGFRFDEKDRIPRGGVDRLTESDGVPIKEVYPLIETEISVNDVYRIISNHGLSVPNFFWQRLFDAVYEQCGPASQKFLEDLPPWTRAYLFNWRSRSNCFMCFYQRLYEWVGLLEHHPKLFDRAEEIERVYGGKRSEFRVERHEDLQMTNDFFFHPGKPLGHIREERHRIFDARVRDVLSQVIDGRKKPRTELDLLSATSCGAMCGK